MTCRCYAVAEVLISPGGLIRTLFWGNKNLNFLLRKIVVGILIIFWGTEKCYITLDIQAEVDRSGSC